MVAKRFPRLTAGVMAVNVVLALAVQLSASASSSDLSGFEKKFVEVVAGKIYRGIQPGDEDDYQYLKQKGIRTQLNLRRYLKWQEADLRERADVEGFLYRHAGMPTMWSEPEDPEVTEALTYLGDESLQPIYIHCRLGKDRTGLIVALYRVLHQNWDACAAWKEWTSFGYKPWNSGLRIYYEKRLRKETQIPNFSPDFDVDRCR